MDEPTVTIPMATVAGVVRRLVRLPEGSKLKRLTRTLYRRLRCVSLNAVYGTELRAIPVPNAEHDFTAVRDFLERKK